MGELAVGAKLLSQMLDSNDLANEHDPHTLQTLHLPTLMPFHWPCLPL